MSDYPSEREEEFLALVVGPSLRKPSCWSVVGLDKLGLVDSLTFSGDCQLSLRFLHHLPCGWRRISVVAIRWLRTLLPLALLPLALLPLALLLQQG